MAIARFLQRSPACRSLLGLARTRILPARPFLRASSPPPLHSLPSLLPSVRRFATSSGGDFELLRILKDEIEHERQTDAVSNREKKQPPKPFTLDDKPGAQEVFLHRSYNEEDIEVACVFHTQSYPQMDDEGAQGEEDAPTQLVQMTVRISKGADNPFLEIHCVTYGDEPVIDRVSYKEPSTSSKDLPYEGPQFSDLDDNVQTGFQKYLTARGIDGDLGSYLLTYMYHKEQREYSSWLRSVEEFINK